MLSHALLVHSFSLMKYVVPSTYNKDVYLALGHVSEEAMFLYYLCFSFLLYRIVGHLGVLVDIPTGFVPFTLDLFLCGFACWVR